MGRAADIEMSADHMSSGGPRFERPTLSWERDFSLFELAAVRSGKSCVGVMVIKTFVCGYCINLLFWADAMSSDLPNPSAARGTRPRAGRRRSCPSCSRHQCRTRVPCRVLCFFSLRGRGWCRKHQPIGTATTAAFSHGRWRRHRSAKLQGGEVQSYATAHVSRSGSALLTASRALSTAKNEVRVSSDRERGSCLSPWCVCVCVCVCVPMDYASNRKGTESNPHGRCILSFLQ